MRGLGGQWRILRTLPLGMPFGFAVSGLWVCGVTPLEFLEPFPRSLETERCVCILPCT